MLDDNRFYQDTSYESTLTSIKLILSYRDLLVWQRLLALRQRKPAGNDKDG